MQINPHQKSEFPAQSLEISKTDPGDFSCSQTSPWTSKIANQTLEIHEITLGSPQKIYTKAPGLKNCLPMGPFVFKTALSNPNQAQINSNQLQIDPNKSPKFPNKDQVQIKLKSIQINSKSNQEYPRLSPNPFKSTQIRKQTLETNPREND